jgi:hypothetical protein
MYNDLDSKDMAIRARDYIVENPNKILKLDPDQGGSSRGYSGPMPDNSKGPHPSTAEAPAQKQPGETTSPVTDITDTVMLSPEAMKAISGPPPEIHAATPEPQPPDAAPPSGHINLTA